MAVFACFSCLLFFGPLIFERIGRDSAEGQDYFFKQDGERKRKFLIIFERRRRHWGEDVQEGNVAPFVPLNWMQILEEQANVGRAVVAVDFLN
jgi:hypothetical protein